MKKVIIYTDGACSGNPGPGGWGAILKFGEIEKEISGCEAETTNNRMEIQAVIEALSLLKESCDVELYSDSAYVVNAFEKNWVESWQKNSWHKSNKEPVKNIDLWERLLELVNSHNVSWTLVKGHADNEYNNRCDRLAVNAIQKSASISGEKLATQPNEQLNEQPDERHVKPLNLAEELVVPDGPKELVEITTNVERKYTGGIFAVDRFYVNTPEGNPAIRDVMRHPGGAVVIAVDDNQDVIMERQFRRGVNAVMYELPAGKLEYGEDPFECAMRELQEETGYAAETMELLTAMRPTCAVSDETLYIYLATGLKKVSSQNLDDNEYVEVEKENLDVLIEKVFTGEITDAKTIIGILMADRMING